MSTPDFWVSPDQASWIHPNNRKSPVKTIVVAISIALISFAAQAEVRTSGKFSDESKTSSENSVSEDTNISVWGSQALWNSRHPILQRCLNLPRTLPTEPVVQGRNGRLLKEESEIDRYPLALESSVCSMLIASAAKQASYAFVGKKKIPLPTSPEAADAVARIPVDSLYAKAKQTASFPEERLIELAKGEFAWRVFGTTLGYEVKNGQFNISMGGKPWFDDRHIEGRSLTFKQARSSGSSSGVATQYIGEMGGK
jgi:hypothetical protein